MKMCTKTSHLFL